MRLTAFMLALGFAGPALALITHPAGDNMPANLAPTAQVVGRYGTNASAVAIGPNTIVTTKHQGNSNTVVFNGLTYQVNQVYNEPNDHDLRVITLHLNGQPQLTHVSVYAGSDEAGQTATFGGYGRGRGADLPGGHGYAWAPGTNNTLRFGQNNIDSAEVLFDMPTLTADFDAPGAGLLYEATVAQYDSGGGVFLNDNGTWKVAGLIYSVEHRGGSIPNGVGGSEAWFDNPYVGGSQPDRILALRLSEYADWIASVPEPGSLLALLALPLALRRRR